MRSPGFITRRMLALFAFALALGAPNVNAQSLALIAPNKTELDKNIVSRLRDSYSGIFKAQDPDMCQELFVGNKCGLGQFRKYRSGFV